MKIIDFHNHLCLPDVTGEKLIAEMDRNEVERTLVLGVTRKYQNHIGNNEAVKDLLAAYPDRIIGGFEVNPLQIPEALELIGRYSDKGFRVVKMYPLLGFYPDDERVFPVYEEIAGRGLMVLYHMGGASTGLLGGDLEQPVNISGKYGRPRFVDALGFRFPETVFIMAHMGGGADYVEATMMIANHKNIFVDCSCTSYRPVFKGLKAREEYLVRPVNFQKILWGLDATPERYESRIRETQELMTELGWEKHIPDVFYNNAKKLIG